MLTRELEAILQILGLPVSVRSYRVGFSQLELLEGSKYHLRTL